MIRNSAIGADPGFGKGGGAWFRILERGRGGLAERLPQVPLIFTFLPVKREASPQIRAWLYYT